MTMKGGEDRERAKRASERERESGGKREEERGRRTEREGGREGSPVRVRATNKWD